ncbi:MAG: pyridoxamine 5'-phosphate oxidase family protein [Verrucomicrobiales bacterium]|jgi:nitroimidazol reductase NimA-like FMN-containing flavoprotein (pyridoxamine 5'-phosphate oxidase superfamily)|nr:pyridoxamine 5'-phosphate oxidase family protein [Verrucomicrobiales bacterium]
MRRTDREIEKIDDKINIINQCKVCRLGLTDGNQPYIVPLNYGYAFENGTLTLFFHSALEGRKNEIINNNRQACFEVDCDHQLLAGAGACRHGYVYKSVIGFGEITILENDREKNAGLNRIMKHQTGRETEYHFTETELKKVLVYKMTVEKFTGKQRSYPEK